MITRIKNLRFKSQDDFNRVMNTVVIVIIVLTVFTIFLAHTENRFTYVKEVKAQEVDFKEVTAYITGYNTVPEQTDDTPCIAASGKNICGGIKTIACPRIYPFGTVIEVDSIFYVCEDRLATKYDDRFDVNCDKDFKCPAEVTGRKIIKIYE